MSIEQSPQMSRRNPEAVCESVDLTAVVQRPVGDQSQGAGHGGRSAEPGGGSGCRLGAAAATGAKARVFGGGRAGIEIYVVLLGDAGRTHGPAIDPGGVHAGEETSVKARVAGANGPVTSVVVQRHGGMKP